MVNGKNLWVASVKRRISSIVELSARLSNLMSIFRFCLDIALHGQLVTDLRKRG